jgi:Flp pilus assembly protein TadG
VEFTLILPVVLFLFLGMVEFGFAVSHNTSIETATRQGARVGSELVDGTNHKGTSGITAASQGVDDQIIAAVQGVLISPGSPVNIAQVQTIEIFLATDTGAVSGGLDDKWVPAYDAVTGLPNGPAIPGSSPSSPLSFKPDPAAGNSNGGTWDASTRSGVSTAQNIGVKITYTYKFITPLGAVLKATGKNLFPNGQITMSDQTVMAMEPPTP